MALHLISAFETILLSLGVVLAHAVPNSANVRDSTSSRLLLLKLDSLILPFLDGVADSL